MANLTNATNFVYKTSNLINFWTNKFVTRIVVAVVILLIGFVIGRLVGKLVARLLHEVELNKILNKALRTSISIEESIGRVVSYFIYFITVVTALNQLGLTTTILYMIAGAIIILIVLSVLLGIKDMIPNIFSGFVILRKKKLNIGDVIRFKGMEGKIMEITLTEIKIKTKSGDIIFIPNSALAKTELIKKEKGNKKARKR